MRLNIVQSIRHEAVLIIYTLSLGQSVLKVYRSGVLVLGRLHEALCNDAVPRHDLEEILGQLAILPLDAPTVR